MCSDDDVLETDEGPGSTGAGAGVADPGGDSPGSGDPADVVAVRGLLAAYCQTLDDGRFDDWVELFTEDCRFVVMGTRTRGRHELRALIEPNQTAELRGKHMISEPLIDLDGDAATVATDFMFISKTNQILKAGRYHDVLRRHRDIWRIAGREIVFMGSEPLGLDG